MLPIAKTPIEWPTEQVPLPSASEASDAPGSSELEQQKNAVLEQAPSTGAGTPTPPAMATVPLKECGLCSARKEKETWSAQPPTRPEDEANWVSIMESKVHGSCLAQAFAEKLIVQVPIVERSAGSKTGVEDQREFATRCLEPTEKLPLICVVDGTLPAPIGSELASEWMKPFSEVEVPVMAVEPLAIGFRVFEQLAPPRTLEDLLQSTSKLSKNGRMAESSHPIDIRRTFPTLWNEVRRAIPVFALPGGPCDLLWRDPRNRTRASCVKLTIHSPGSVLRAQRSRFRACTQLISTGSQIDWAAVGMEDAEKLLEMSKELRSPEDDPVWVPDLCFCVRHSARVYCGQQSISGSTMLAFPGALYWAHVRGTSSGSTLVTQWSFAERSRLAFEYALLAAMSRGARTEELRELDACLDSREDILFLRLFQEILKHDEERMHLLPKDLAEALALRLLKACQETPVDAPRGTTIPPEAQIKVRCDACRSELFERRVYCSECDEQNQDSEHLIDLVATHPPRSSNKKDRSTLPDWLRVGCRVLVNLTVSGNSNDKPPRVVGAAHLPAIVLKTGHGFFTVHLEGAHEQVVKRKAAIEPHPDGPQLSRGFRVKVRAEGGGGSEPQILLANLRECVYCCDCFAKIHASRSHAKKSALYVDGRVELAKQFEVFKKEILQRSAIRKDDLCVWNPRASITGGEDIPEGEDEESKIPRCIPKVSAEAGQRAMQLAQIMGPSPYHYPGVPGGSPQSGKLSAVIPPPQEELLDRRLRTTRKRVFSDMLEPTKTTTQSTASSNRPTSASLDASSGTKTLVNAAQKRNRSGSAHNAGQQTYGPLDIVEEEPVFQHMEQHLAQAGLPQVDMQSALQNGSFFVGRKSLSILLEADAVVKAHAELLDANKPEELRALWAKARRDVPLKKVWRFISFENNDQANVVGKRRAIDALAESAAAAEPAREVA